MRGNRGDGSKMLLLTKEYFIISWVRKRVLITPSPFLIFVYNFKRIIQ